MPILLFLLNLTWALQTESLGRFNLRGFGLTPTYIQQQPSENDFRLEKSFLTFEWKKEESISGIVQFGSKDLFPRPIWYSETNRQDWGLSEGYIEAHSSYVDVMIGLIPLRFGYEGVLDSNFWFLPQSALGRVHLFAERDYGLAVVSRRQGLFAQLSIHNGEGGTNVDGRTWMTGSWGFFRRQSLGFNISAQAGSTEPIATSLSTAAQNGINWDPDSANRIRLGEASFFYQGQKEFFLAAAGAGHVSGLDKSSDMSWGRIEGAVSLGGDLRLLSRVEQYQLDVSRASSKNQIYSLGFSAESDDRLVQMTILYSALRESPMTNNDQVYLGVRLSSEILQND